MGMEQILRDAQEVERKLVELVERTNEFIAAEEKKEVEWYVSKMEERARLEMQIERAEQYTDNGGF